MSGKIITFTNLFPSAAFATHGLFVQDRMRRVVATGGFEWCVVAPLPRVPAIVRRGDYALQERMPDREERDGITIEHPRYAHLPGFSTARHAARMQRACLATVRRLAARGPVVLDAHYVYPDGVAALRIARELGLPCVVTARGTDLNVLAAMPAVARQIRDAAASAHALLAVSEPLRRRFVEVSGQPDDRVRLVRNGVDLDRFRPGDGSAARTALGLPSDGPLILGVGRLAPGKGFRHAVAALADLPGARLVLVGDGPERAALERAAPAGRLLCLGRQGPDRVAEAYRACDVLVLPSEREGWPNVVTEALASGLPVVATDVGGIPDILTEPSCGRTVAVGDQRGLVDALRTFLEDAPSRAAVRAFAGRYSWEAPVADLVALFRDALTPGALPT